jgi:hypothetical protein
MRLTRRKSTTAKVTDWLGTYVKFKAASKAAKGARKAATHSAAYKTVSRRPGLKRLPIVVGAAVAAFAASRLLRGGEGGGAATA